MALARPAPHRQAWLFGLLWLPLLLMLCGCTLIDRRTFAGGNRVAPQSAQMAQAGLPQLPLVTIRFGQGESDYGPMLSDAVQAAQGRKPDVVFDIVTPVPTAAGLDVQDRFMRQGQEDAEEVATAIAYAGIPQDRIRLSFRGDPGNPAREVRVYVR
jgi:hypothetical protein